MADGSVLELALSIALEAHTGQRDKAGQVYVLHPLRLMMKMASEPAMATAVLHDVVEDSEWTLDRLREAGIPADIVEAVGLLTHKPGQTYEEFVETLAGNPLARGVKLADLEDNLDTLRLESLGPKDLERIAKYHKARRRLLAAPEA